MSHPSDPVSPARFTVYAAFNVTGRGAIVAGQLDRGTVRTGDQLRWTLDGVVRHETCTGVSPMLVRDPAAPPMLGLFVSNVEPSDFAKGLVIEVVSDRSDRGPLGDVQVSG